MYSTAKPVAVLLLWGLSAAFSFEAPAQDPAQLWDAARTVLEKHCHPCHGANGKAASDFVVLDPGELKSKIDDVRDRVLTSGDMPPVEHKATYQTRYGVSTVALKQLQLAPPAKAAIKGWLDGGGQILAASTGGAAAFVRDDDLIEALLADVRTLTEADRKLVRYLSLANLLRAGESSSRLSLYRNAVRKLLASLTWKEGAPPRVVVVPGTEGTALRLDLSDLVFPYAYEGEKPKLGYWHPALWDEIAAKYPYELPLTSSREAGGELQDALGTSYLFLRADWFVTHLTQPEVYARFLGLPKTVRELERILLGVDTARNLEQGIARRSGTTDSGVSSNHRIIEHHPLASGGYYWVSYDFVEPKGKANILDHPTDFAHAGGEFIFSLPNGLQAYFLATARGDQLGVAPTEIVQNSSRKDAVVLNGISCIECHADGLRDIKDQLRDFITATLDPRDPRLVEVRRLHPGPAPIAKLIAEGRTRFREAISRLGFEVPADKEDQAAEPISRLVAHFENTKVGVRIAAAELDMSEAEFETELKTKLAQRNAALRRLYARLKYTTVSRNEFIDEFDRLRRQFFEGQIEAKSVPSTVRLPAGSSGPPQPGKSFSVPGVGIEMIWIEPGTFTAGSPVDERGRFDDETQHTVQLTQGFWLAQTETTQKQYFDLRQARPSHFKTAGSNAPVERVSWDDAMEFCRKLTEQERTVGRLPEGYEYSLPTVAQWEYAARAGTTGAIYGSDLGSIAWFYDNSSSTTHPVGQKQANAWGLQDMIGNVWEWCFDFNEANRAGRVSDPQGPTTGVLHIFCGGSWNASERLCRFAKRNGNGPRGTDPDLGFRPALRSVRK